MLSLSHLPNVKQETRRRDPSPAEIREICRQIQKEWTNAERKRRQIPRVKIWTIPTAKSLVEFY